MKEDFNFGKKDVINNDSNPHDVAALFKEFLRCLPDPLLTRELYCAFMKSGRKLCFIAISACLLSFFTRTNRSHSYLYSKICSNIFAHDFLSKSTYIRSCVVVIMCIPLMHNYIQQSLNAGSAQI